ncbi:hypothetical protein L5515_019423 [Caenorhabditis briggsae]|uniref:Uncharacterized protein n=1 Tax=Caenorhabditis briggsae TaxID=6238 RepID=A0AAE9JVF1_CAEBR|nr:hypothetical protein L5515_019423 [Caenorhabditis briggsae]
MSSNHVPLEPFDITRMIDTTENEPTLEGEELERARRIDDRVVDYTRRIVEGAMRHLENRIQAMVEELEKALKRGVHHGYIKKPSSCKLGYD